MLRQKLPALAPSMPPPPITPSYDEHINEVRVGDFEGDRLRQWGTPKKRRLSLRDESFTLSQYPQHVHTVSRGDTISMILVQDGYPGRSTGGIAIGDSAHRVRQRYGVPSRMQELSPGQTWCYDAPGIAFHLRHEKVISWLLYDA